MGTVQAMHMGRMEVVAETYEEHGIMVHWRYERQQPY
jgi:hypothetical protein